MPLSVLSSCSIDQEGSLWPFLYAKQLRHFTANDGHAPHIPPPIHSWGWIGRQATIMCERARDDYESQILCEAMKQFDVSRASHFNLEHMQYDATISQASCRPDWMEHVSFHLLMTTLQGRGLFSVPNLVCSSVNLSELGETSDVTDPSPWVPCTVKALD
jgi:hypothetical protein